MKISTNSIIAFFLLVYFIIRTHGIAGYIPSIWVAPLFIFFVFSVIIILKLSRLILEQFIKDSKWIILSFIFLLICIYFEYGNFKLYDTFHYLGFSIPFYIIGFYWGLSGGDKNLKYTVVGYFIFISLYLFTKLIQVNNFANITPETIGWFFYVAGGFTLNDLTFFWPFAAFVSILAYAFFAEQNQDLIKKILILTLTSICLISFLVSGVAAPLVLIFTTILIYYFIKNGLKGKIKLLVTLPFIILFYFLTIFLLGSDTIGTFGNITSKSGGVLLLIDSGKFFDEDIFNVILSDRWTSAGYSFNQFLEKPFIGHGCYLDTLTYRSGITIFLGASGGHSFVLDSLAYYGIFGVLLIMILIKFSRNALQYFRIADQKEKKTALIFASLIISLFISNILNSTFLGSSFDNFVFLCCGFFLGKYYIIKYSTFNLIKE
jgi:hypothetical protein